MGSTGTPKRAVWLLWASSNVTVNPLNAELNPIRHLLELAGAHHFVDVSRIRVKRLITMHFQISHIIFAQIILVLELVLYSYCIRCGGNVTDEKSVKSHFLFKFTFKFSHP
jgi:hypothetical protein